MSGEPMDVPESDLVAELGYVPCTALSKQSRARCRRRPVPGLTVCVMHGGKSPAAQAKAADNLQQQAAEGEIRKLWVGLKDARPVQDPVESMSRLAGGLEELLDRVGEKVNEITHLGAGSSLGQIRGELVLLERVAALLARLLDAMARLGIEERQAQFQQAQAQAITAAYRLALGAVVSSLLTPADKDLMVRTFMSGLGWSAEELEAGEAS